MFSYQAYTIRAEGRVAKANNQKLIEDLEQSTASPNLPAPTLKALRGSKCKVEIAPERGESLQVRRVALSRMPSKDRTGPLRAQRWRIDAELDEIVKEMKCAKRREVSEAPPRGH